MHHSIGGGNATIVNNQNAGSAAFYAVDASRELAGRRVPGVRSLPIRFAGLATGSHHGRDPLRDRLRESGGSGCFPYRLSDAVGKTFWLLPGFRRAGNAGVDASVWKTLEPVAEHFQPIVSKPLGERIWKFVVSDIAYCFLYLTAGMIIFPWVKDFYATQHIPPMTTIVALQLLLRGPIFILMCLALVRMLGLPRLGGALAVGAVFTIVSGIAPLLTPNAFFPDIVRWAHLCEVTSSNFLFGAIVAWLWGRPTFAHAPALHQAA